MPLSPFAQRMCRDEEEKTRLSSAGREAGMKFDGKGDQTPSLGTRFEDAHVIYHVIASASWHLGSYPDGKEGPEGQRHTPLHLLYLRRIH